MSEHGGIQKRMRKGTRSCLPCRKRKIKCTWAGENGEACRECQVRDTECSAQGLVRDDEDDLARRLQERVAVLEASLQELKQSSSTSPLIARGDGHESIDRQDALRGPSETSSPAAGSFKCYAAATVESSTAPLMHLLNNPVLGAPREALTAVVNDGSRFEETKFQTSLKYQEAVRDLAAHLPSQAEISEICNNHSSWWPLYRETLGCLWGDGDLQTLRSFATQVLEDMKPQSLALLLVCFAISTGELERFLSPVERRIVNDDEYAGTEGGLNCLMGLGQCYMASLQPRRAWTVYRRANGLIQLNGLHIRRRTMKHDTLFWELFHADRWVSITIGLPYSMPDALCNINIPPLTEIDEGTWLYRHLCVLSGRVIDVLQAVKGAALPVALDIEEDMENLKSQLSPGYLSLGAIRTSCTNNLMEKYTRLFRVVHFHQLRAFLHLPFLLRSATQERYRFSSKSCTDDSRKLLEAYLEIYDTNPAMVYNATVISFNAFICAGILLLHLIGYGRSKDPEHVQSRTQSREDWNMFHRFISVLKQGAKHRSVGMLCQTCHTALETLLESARGSQTGEATKVVLPYFGTLSITRHNLPAEQAHAVNKEWVREAATTTQPATVAAPPTGADLPMDLDFDLGTEFTYDGPFLPDGNVADWTMGYDWYGSSSDPDWSWLGADLPPNVGL